MANKNKKFKRKCIVCSKLYDKSDLIRITQNFKTNELEFNSENKIFGRSFYICKDKECLEKALKPKQLNKYTKLQLSQKITDEIVQVINYKKN